MSQFDISWRCTAANGVDLWNGKAKPSDRAGSAAAWHLRLLQHAIFRRSESAREKRHSAAVHHARVQSCCSELDFRWQPETLLGLRIPVPAGREAVHECGIFGSPVQGTQARPLLGYRPFRPLFVCFPQGHKISHVPQSICNASGHCWSYAQCTMNLDEVVREIIERNRCCVVLQFARDPLLRRV